MFTIYALYNKEVGKIYIGQTLNIDKRLREHNRKLGRHFTSQFQGEWELIYQESVATRPEALKREKQLKSGNGRAFIKSHIPG